MSIKFLDLHKQTKKINQEIFASLKENIKSSSFIGGHDLKEFEKEFSLFNKIKYSQTVANGTDALEIALKALNLKKNSEVIVPANTWISTAEAVLNNNLKIKFVDIDDTHNICVEDLKKRINTKTSAIIIVHLFGNPARMMEIMKLSKQNNLKVIEDCAQAHGATYKSQNVSTFGNLSTFSFFPSKNLGCFGDGGCIVTNNKKYYLECKKISNHGGLKKNSHLTLGRNSRLDNIQAGVLRIKLKKLNLWIKQRNVQANEYYKCLGKNKNISFVERIKETKSSYHLFVIRANKRNELKKYLSSKKIETGIHYPLSLPSVRIFKSKHYSYCKNMKSIKLSKQILSLPIGEHLNINDIRKICTEINNFFNV